MKATFEQPTKEGFNPNHRKESAFMAEYAVFPADAKRPAVTLRIYGTGARNYACLWVNAGGIHTIGSDFAGGYGYHRPSAAAYGAFKKAGFTFDEGFSGYGESAMEAACLAVAECLGVSGAWIHKANA